MLASVLPAVDSPKGWLGLAAWLQRVPDEQCPAAPAGEAK